VNAANMPATIRESSETTNDTSGTVIAFSGPAALLYEVSLEGHVTARPALQNRSVARFL
jgi:hypothetical protein